MASGFLFPDLCNSEYADETPTSEDIDEDVILTNNVRQTYFDYLHRMIGENASFINATPESVMKIAQNMEMTVIKRALRTANYRVEMLKAIRDVKDKTLIHTVLEGLCPKEMNNSSNSEAENIPGLKFNEVPQDAPEDAACIVYNSICAEMEKIFQEEPEIPSSPEDASQCPKLWDSEYHIQKSLWIQLLNIICKFNPPKYLQLAEKLEILFNMDFGDKSLRGTPEPFDEVQRHCKRRTTLMLKHYIKPYYVNFQGNRNFQKFMQSCADRLARSTPHIGAQAISKGISNAFESKEMSTIQDDTIKDAIDSVIKHITDYNSKLREEARNNRKKNSEEQ